MTVPVPTIMRTFVTARSCAARTPALASAPIKTTKANLGSLFMYSTPRFPHDEVCRTMVKNSQTPLWMLCLLWLLNSDHRPVKRNDEQQQQRVDDTHY